MKLISIIIPVYNRPEAFEKTLASVLAQTYKNIEIIVVDDGSDQPISNLAIEQLSNDTRVKLIRQENKGAPVARNAGLQIAQGEYVIFWDADVVGKPNMLEKMYTVLENNEGASFVYCNHVTHTTYHISKKISSQKFDVAQLKRLNYIHSTSLIRRQDAVKWDENLKRFQDWDLWLTMVEQDKKGVWLDEYLFEIISSGGMSTWLPSCAYKKPWKYLPWFAKTVKRYEDAKQIIVSKHHLC